MNMRGGAFKLIVSATLALFSTSVFALDPTEQLSELSHTRWMAREGAPTNVQDIGQTNDGISTLGTLMPSARRVHSLLKFTSYFKGQSHL
jgi:hypothetical protein